MAVEPHALELLRRHVLCTRDGAAAGWMAAETGEWLVHVPFRGGVEECEFVARLEALWSDEDVHVPSVKYLFQSTSLLRDLTSFTSISTPDFGASHLFLQPPAWTGSNTHHPWPSNTTPERGRLTRDGSQE
uniref:Uncharacterized protein n=1 Tax=Photinus pyralis TaxID=7054 RepID=A0A1Y1K1W5_PHOPY